MPHRLMGLETEFCVRCSSPSPFAHRPSKKEVCLAILRAVDRVVPAAPGDRAGEPHFQHFVQNGGAFSFEVVPIGSNDGLLESATPECRGASQLLLYQRAQEAVIQRALPVARARLAGRGFDVDLAVVKNSRDADGHVFGTQENYEVEIARGWRLLLYRSGLAVLLPVITLLLVLLFIAGVLAFFVIAAIALVFPAARQYFRDFDLDSSPLSDWGDLRSDFPPRFLRVSAAIAMAVASPVALSFLLFLRLTAFHAIRSRAMAFLVSRQVVTGAGTLHDDGRFGLSERAESISSTIRTSVRQRSRSLFDTANILKRLFMNDGIVRSVTGLFSRRQRLQLGSSDSNCAQTAEFLKVGVTSLVLDMIEAGFLDDAPRVLRPVKALKQISRDTTLRTRVAVADGGAMTALELQRWYLRRAETYLSSERVASLESWEIVRLWRTTLQALEHDPFSLVGRIDWVTKHVLMADADTLGHAARKKIDIKYHEIGSGYFAMLERRGLAPVRLSSRDVREAIFRPPEDTPAWERGESIRLAGDSRTQMRIQW